MKKNKKKKRAVWLTKAKRLIKKIEVVDKMSDGRLSSLIIIICCIVLIICLAAISLLNR